MAVQMYFLAEQEIISAHKSCLAGSHLLGYLNSMPARAIPLWQGCVSLPPIPSYRADGKQAAQVGWTWCS